MLYFLDRKLMVPGDCGGKSMHRVGKDGTCVDCGFVNPPSVEWDHPVGPMVTLGNGEVRWLTPWERLMYRLGFRSAEDFANRAS